MWGEPSNHKAGLTSAKEVGKEGGLGRRVSDLRAVLRKATRVATRVTLSHSPPLEESHSSPEWACVSTAPGSSPA